MATRKLNTKGRREDKYKGNYPSVFKKVEQSDFKKPTSLFTVNLDW